MFLRWKRRTLVDRWRFPRSRCSHAPATRLTPVVLLSYRDGHGRPKHETVWRLGVCINECCIDDVATRMTFWEACEKQFAALSQPPLVTSMAGILAGEIPWLRATIAVRVPPLSDDDLVEILRRDMLR